MTVADIDALLYLPGHPRRAAASGPCASRRCSPGWQASFQALLDAAGGRRDGGQRRADRGRARRRRGRGSARCGSTAIRARERTVLSLSGWPTRGQRAAASRAARAVPDRPAAAASPGGRRCVRSYSLSGPPERPIPDQRQARAARRGQPLHARHRVRAGDRLDVAAPRGTFTLARATAPVLLISAGVGATPVLAMLHALAARRLGPRGLVAARRAQPGRARRSPPRPARCSRALPARAPRMSATAAPSRATRPAGTTTAPGG